MKHLILAGCLALGLLASNAHAADNDGDAVCQTLSTHLLDALDHGDFSAATTDFDARMKAGLSSDTLSKVWLSVPQQFGARGEREPAQTAQVAGSTLVTTSLHYGSSLIDARVACDASGKISGFHIVPHTAAKT
ncbi:DUF3887 domain-containing protein [Dyella silvatica]|uniref:DUF3887 domain-containing protein n=1 Tax=Dyella silvatica TaxID=2992128 RepID=UPI002256B5BA|nr:DUF3887 domain-containing protein [Dyella silvatica]